MSVLVITGTDTGVGKTIATAALASAVRTAGGQAAVCKPVQTGAVPGGGDPAGDLAEVARLSGVSDLVGVASYREPLAPAAAAALDGLTLPSLGELVAAVRAVDRPDRLTLVEGAGGLLVEIAAGGATLRDLAAALTAPVLVVCRAGLGTLNHTALTVEALGRVGISCGGLVIGCWPEDPGAAESYNREALQRFAPVRAVLPAGSGGLTPPEFAAMSRRVFDPRWVAGLT